MVDGPISIPLMKRSGFPPHFAAGVEAIASTGGQIMPPIMGAAAFVMAEFLGVSYGAGGDLGDHPGGALLRRLLRGRAFRGQAPRPGRPAALRIAAARHGDARARASVHSGGGHPRRDVFRLQRADGGARRHARLFPGRGLAQVHARLCDVRECHRSLRRRRAERAPGRAGLRLRRHRDRRGHAVRARHRVHAIRGRAVARTCCCWR